ncbi:MAG: DUF3298 and DUF4163 domain-containing protein [Prevotella sp.]|nr:DUF3298 and DUF4163 domain-containing protein [Prevotella sp.]
MRAIIATALAAVAIMTACGNKKGTEGTAPAAPTETATLKIDTTAAPTDSADSVSCRIQLSVIYAQTAAPCALNDSVKGMLRCEYFTPKATDDVPTAVRAFVKAYIDNYRSEATMMLAEGASAAACSYQLILSTGLVSCSDSVATYTAERYDFMGGAHGQTTFTAFGYDPRSMRTLTLADVAGSIDRQLTIGRITEGVARHFGKKDIAALRDIGVFSGVEPYIPPTVVYGRDSARFVFNQYDIAPYAAGRIVVGVAYKDMRKQ